MKIFFVFISFLVVFSLFSQNNLSEIDSLETVLPALEERESLDVLINLTLLYLNEDPQSSIRYGNQAIQLAEKFNLKAKKAQLHTLVGVAYEYRGNFTKALELYNKSLDIANSIESLDLIASALINIAVVNQNMGKHDVSLNYNLQALEMYREMENNNGIANALNNIGNVYLYMEQYEKALNYYLQAIEKKKTLKAATDIASTYHNIALVYQALAEYDAAVQYYDLALEDMRANNDRYSMAICYANLSSLYYLTENYNKALFYITESLHLHEKMQNTELICSAKINLANIFIKTGRFAEAEKILQENLTFAQENEFYSLKAEILESYSHYYQETGDYKNALDFHTSFKALQDSLNQNLNRQKIAELSIQYETAQREKVIELLKQQAIYSQKTRNFLIIVILLGIIFLIILLNLYYSKVKDTQLRQEMQEKLQQSEHKYRTLTEYLKVAVYTYNIEGRFNYVNKATCDISGYSEHELLKMHFYDLIHPKHRDLVQRRGLARLKGDDIPSNYEFMIITKNGEIKWLETSNVRVNIGGIIMVLGTSLDVTDRYIAHEKLQESEAQLRAIFSAMDDVIFTMDNKGTYLSIAPTNPDLMYKPVEETVGKKLHDIFPKQQADYFLSKIQECLIKQDVVAFDYQLPIKNELLWFDGRLTPISDNKILMVARNITERKKSLAKLVESEEKYRNLVESIEEGMAIVDADHNFLFVNKAASKIFGYRTDELLSMNVQEIFSEEMKEEFLENFERRKQGEKTKYEAWINRKDDSRKLLKISSAPLFKKDEFVGSVSIFSDITEMHAAEEKIKASLREKEVMLQEIYHRVKNNMQIISSMLKLQSLHINKENALELFKNSQSRVKSMSLVHEKLYRSRDLSRINAKDYFSSLLKQIFVSYSLQAKDIKYTIDCEDINLDINSAIPCGLIANELITNSLKHAFSDEGGLVTLRFKSLDDDKFKLEIGNNGKDFPENFTLENASSFGLQLVDILSKQLHADFDLERKEGANFVFIFKELKK